MQGSSPAGDSNLGVRMIEEKAFVDHRGTTCFTGLVTVDHVKNTGPCYDGGDTYLQLHVASLDVDSLFNKFITNRLEHYTADELVKIFEMKIRRMKEILDR